MKKTLNQKLINLIEFYSLVNSNLLLSNSSLKRSSNNTTITFNGTKIEKLDLYVVYL